MRLRDLLVLAVILGVSSTTGMKLLSVGHATEMYTYMGHIEQGGLALSGCNTCYFTGSFTTPAPLSPNLPLTQVSPLSFAFSDGGTTIDNSNFTTPTVWGIYVGTDVNGQINVWDIQVDGPGSLGGLAIIQTFNDIKGQSPLNGGSVGDGIFQYNPNLLGYAFNQNDPGTWTESPPLSDVPEPAALSLLGAGLLVVLGFHRRRSP